MGFGPCPGSGRGDPPSREGVQAPGGRGRGGNGSQWGGGVSGGPRREEEAGSDHPRVAANAERLLGGGGAGAGPAPRGPPRVPGLPPCPRPWAYNPGFAQQPALLRHHRLDPGKVALFPITARRWRGSRARTWTGGKGADVRTPVAPGGRRPDSCCSNAWRPDSWVPQAAGMGPGAGPGSVGAG